MKTMTLKRIASKVKVLLQKARTYQLSNWRSIEFCPAWNYLQYQQTGDVRYILKGIDYENMPELFKTQINRLSLICAELSIQCAQFEIDNNRRNKNIFELSKKIEIRTAEYNNVRNICKYLEIAGSDPYFEDILKAAGHRVNADNIKESIKRILASNENLLPKINQDKRELESLTKQTEESKTSDIEQTVIALEKHNKKDIDLKKISIKKYLTLKHDLNTYFEKVQADRLKNKKM